MDEFASLAIEAIVAARKRAEEARKRQQETAVGNPVTTPAPPGRRPPAGPPALPPRPAGTQRSAATQRPAPTRPATPPAAPPLPERSLSPFGGSLVEPIDSPLLELEPLGGPIADGGRAARRTVARSQILAIFASPASLIGGVIVSEVLAPPLSLRPPKTGA